MQPNATAVECIADDEDAFDDGSAASQHSVREVKSKVSDFSRFVDSIATENETNKKELVASQKRAVQLTEKVAVLVSEVKEHEQAKERLFLDIEKQETLIQDLRDANADLQHRVDNFANQNTELMNLRSTVAAVNGQIRDYITLESSGSPLITTTGQVRFLKLLCCLGIPLSTVFQIQR